jgi:SMI1 / KNR4 family (SUKH-1)
MNRRTDIHDRFVARFHFGDRPTPVTEQALDAIEAELDTRLPTAYRQFMTRHGAVYTPDILGIVVDRNIDHVDLKNIDGPQEAVEGTKGYWSGGMPKDVIGIAWDHMGNMIGFRRQFESSDDAPVVFFDHEFVDVYEIAPSFDELLLWYLQNL